MIRSMPAVVAPSRPLSANSHRHTAVGLAPGARAALMNPAGFSQMSSCQSSASRGAGIGSPPAPSWCQACFPLTTKVCCSCSWSGVPPIHPGPYFQERGFRPGFRSKVSTDERAS